MGILNVSILMPYAYADDARARSFQWNVRRWNLMLPKAELVLDAPDLVGDPQHFNRPQAINRAAMRAHGDVFLVADADTTIEPVTLRAVLEVVESGCWTLPKRYVRLSQTTSNRWLVNMPHAGPPANWEMDLDQEYPFPNSGVVVMPRAAFDAVGGYDERFKNWGGDDDAMRAAMETLWAPPTRIGIAYHLWHPRAVEHSPEQFALADRYGDVSGDRCAMEALLAER